MRSCLFYSLMTCFRPCSILFKKYNSIILHQVQDWRSVFIIQVCLFAAGMELGMLFVSYPQEATFSLSFSLGQLYCPLPRAAHWNQSGCKAAPDTAVYALSKAFCQEHIIGLQNWCERHRDKLQRTQLWAISTTEGLQPPKPRGSPPSCVTPPLPREALNMESFRWRFARCCLWGLGESGTCSLTLSPEQPSLMPSQTFCKSCTFNRACKKTKGLLLK